MWLYWLSPETDQRFFILYGCIDIRPKPINALKGDTYSCFLFLHHAVSTIGQPQPSFQGYQANPAYQQPNSQGNQFANHHRHGSEYDLFPEWKLVVFSQYSKFNVTFCYFIPISDSMPIFQFQNWLTNSYFRSSDGGWFVQRHSCSGIPCFWIRFLQQCWRWIEHNCFITNLIIQI